MAGFLVGTLKRRQLGSMSKYHIWSNHTMTVHFAQEQTTTSERPGMILEHSSGFKCGAGMPDHHFFIP